MRCTFTPRSLIRILSLGLLILWMTALAAAGDQDPAEDLYETAQNELSENNYQEAAEQFHRLFEEYGESSYAGDALYWEAFSRYRLGGTSELREGLEALELQYQLYTEASTRRDAAELATRIRGELARRGDAAAAAQIARQATELAKTHAELQAEHVELAREAVEIERETAEMVRELRAKHALPDVPLPDGALPAIPLIPFGFSGEDDTRITALNALYQIDPDRAFPIIEKMLKDRDPETAHLREQALFLLGNYPSSRNETLIIDVVRNDPDPGVQQAALFWLSRNPNETSFAVIEDLIQNSQEPRLQEAAVLALAHHPDDRSVAILKRLAGSEQVKKQTREAAIMGLAEKRTADTYPFLIELYDSIQDYALKEHVLFVIARSYEKESKKWLRDIALSGKEPEELQKTALYLAGEAGFIKTAELTELYKKLKDPGMKEQIIYVLGNSDDPAALDEIIVIAKNEEDTDLRRTAIFWLGSSGDARAADFLEELINEQ